MKAIRTKYHGKPIEITTMDQFERTARALGETCNHIMREMDYMPEHRKEDYLASLKAHAAALLEALENAPRGLK